MIRPLSLATLLCISLASCDKRPPEKVSIAPTKDEVLATCKLETLRETRLTGDAPATENFFTACMASKGYRFSGVVLCMPNGIIRGNPAYNYVTGYFDLGQRGIEDCYVPAI